MNGFNRAPSFRDGHTQAITSYDFDLEIKVTVSMTSYPRSILKVKIEDITENLITLLQDKWQALIDV